MLGNLLSKRAVRDPAWGSWGRGEDGVMLAGNTSAGQRVDQTTALTLTTVFGCVQLITNSIATMPIGVYREVGGASVPARPVPRWIEQPNPEVDRVAWMSQVVTSLLLDGNAFVAPMRNATMQVLEAWVLDPTKVVVRRENGRLAYYVNGDRYSGELIHVRGLTLPGQLRGVSPIEAARQQIGLAMGAVDSASRFYGQGLQMPGVISMPGVPTKGQLRDIKDSWARNHGGSSRHHLPGVLFGGATFTQLAVSPEQAQFLQARQFTSLEITAQIFNLPPDMMGVNMAGASLTYQNIEQRWSEFLRRIMFWLVRVETLVTRLLPNPQYAKLNASSYLRADAKTRYETHKLGIDAGFLMRSEARAYEELEPIDDIDDDGPEPMAEPPDDPEDPQEPVE
jgi:HK97 family phage portal protein